MSGQNKQPLVVDIKRHSLEDGPGIRSVVFFKGCPASCMFCQNPETQNPETEIVFRAARCIGCASCGKACRHGAIDLAMVGRIHRDRCSRCGNCALACPSSALEVVGKAYSVEALTEILMLDYHYYRHSGGGVTLSGGECTMYPDFVGPLLKSLKQNSVHTAVQTSGDFDYESFKGKIMPWVDTVYFDVKIADPETHRQYIGRSNHLSFDNLRRLVSEPGVEVHPRIPLIPGITDSNENLSAIVELLADAGAVDVTMIPYNPMGIEMAAGLGHKVPPLPETFMKPADEKAIYEKLRSLVQRRRQRAVPLPQ
ncbi:MAG: glycyl-radical enzyme activating protein [candidate division Zixibacteria bacterium]|nr:glycyl-radical enzyme activating protein [candidate division Zixibacteria bacterium]MDH3938778.1 glycyl-radical enzyme activating protein [candidate division Zixibacteria bacterium]MDH4032933.1 glycyl-radical enzyme activating protein [candidate division Zixibacteria bacterium]